MKRVLILAFDFPPYHSIGAQRPHSWFRHFKKYGLEPTVITRHWDAVDSAEGRNYASAQQTVEEEESAWGKIVRVPYKANIRDRMIARYGMRRFSWVRKALSLWLTIGQYISFRFDNLAPMYQMAQTELEKQPYAAIIATGEPFVLFRHAALLSAKYGIYWVADYRDGWSTIAHITYYGTLERFLFRYVFRSIEKKYLKNVRLITTAAPNYKTALEALHQSKRVEVVYNGFDDDLLTKQPRGTALQLEYFTVAYAGTLYPYQPIEIFLEGLDLFRKRNPTASCRIVFYGMNFNKAQKERVLQGSSAEVAKWLLFTDKIPKAQLYQEAQQAHLFLLLGDKSVPALAGKLFDYFLLQRQILFVVPDSGPQEEILQACNAGLFCTDAHAVANHLAAQYDTWKAGGTLKFEAEGYEQFSREVQAQKLADLLKEISR